MVVSSVFAVKVPNRRGSTCGLLVLYDCLCVFCRRARRYVNSTHGAAPGDRNKKYAAIARRKHAPLPRDASLATPLHLYKSF